MTESPLPAQANARATPDFDVIVVGGGPTGSTAALTLAEHGLRALMLDRDGRIKPCGGAVPPQLLREFSVPDTLLEARVSKARMVAPSNDQVDMEIGGFVGMVDRGSFDPWLRQRAENAGAHTLTAEFDRVERGADGLVSVHFREGGKRGEARVATARCVIGADGAASRVRAQALGEREKMAHVFAYHEIVRSPEGTTERFDPARCDVYYQGIVSPDFYGWVFPHGGCTSVGAGSAVKGFSLRQAVKRMRDISGLDDNDIVRCEGAPLPLRPLRRWDNGRDVVLAGDAAGAVAPSSGEGIYYGMSSGRFAAEAAAEYVQTGRARALRGARRRFMKAHGKVFLILRIMQHYWYTTDKRREKFVQICRDPDVQRLTWEAYMNKRLVRAKPTTHARIFFKDLAHLMGFNPR